jgi:hypothetical protein
MRNPNSIPKENDLEIPEPIGIPCSPVFSDELDSSPLPQVPNFRRTLVHSLIIHVI